MKKLRIGFSAIAATGLLLLMLGTIAAGNSFAADIAGNKSVQANPEMLLPDSGALSSTTQATENAGRWSSFTGLFSQTGRIFNWIWPDAGFLNDISFLTVDLADDTNLLLVKRGVSVLLDKTAILLNGVLSALRPEAFYPVRPYDDYYFGFTGEDPARDHNAFSLCVIASPFVPFHNNKMQLVTIIDARTNKSFIGLRFSF